MILTYGIKAIEGMTAVSQRRLQRQVLGALVDHFTARPNSRRSRRARTALYAVTNWVSSSDTTQSVSTSAFENPRKISEDRLSDASIAATKAASSQRENRLSVFGGLSTGVCCFLVNGIAATFLAPP